MEMYLNKDLKTLYININNHIKNIINTINQNVMKSTLVKIKKIKYILKNMKAQLN